MFESLKHIDTAFRHIRLFSLLVVLGVCLLSGFLCYRSLRMAADAQERVYILAHGKVLEAMAGERKQNIAVEAKDHIKMFHHHFFTLSPDESQIKQSVAKALYLADGSAKKAYDNLGEQSYYQQLVAANMDQTIEMDSIRLDIESYPYRFTYYGKQRIVRTTSILVRKLVTQGALREVQRSENNPHGFLIEGWETISNTNLSQYKR
ncbi:conjugative transposon protein TraK [Echinicola rosea]|nr:conjugative transposon protein TraK [Echinicola rosea]